MSVNLPLSASFVLDRAISDEDELCSKSFLYLDLPGSHVDTTSFKRSGGG